MSDATTCSCMVNSVEKCSVGSCSTSNIMFQEPFFLHPPGSRPRDGLYINPMSAPYPSSRSSKESLIISTPSVVVNANNNGVNVTASPGTGSGESFYLHSRRDHVYTRISHLFDDTASINSSTTNSRASNDRKDETLTVKVDVHINNNGTLKHQPSSPLVIAPPPPPPPPPPPLPTQQQQQQQQQQQLGNGSVKDSGSEHAYEQIFIKPEEHAAHRKLTDNDSRSNRADRRYSRSSSASESSNMSSEVHCYSSATSTPTLSRNSSNERRSKSPKDNLIERKNSTTSSTRAESEKETKTCINAVSIFRPPPPPPPPPPEIEEVVIVTSKIVENSLKEERRDGCMSNTQEQKSESTITISATTTTSTTTAAPRAVEDEQQQQHQTSQQVSSPVSNNDNETHQNGHQLSNNHQVTAHLVNRHMVLPFIPPKFANQAADSDTLLKPSEYLRSICKTGLAHPNTSSLAKARSVDNLDLRSTEEHNHDEEEEEEEEEEEIQNGKSYSDEEEEEEEEQDRRNEASGPPPPPLPPPPMNGLTNLQTSSSSSSSPSSANNSSSVVDGDISSKTQQQQQQQQPLATISIQDLTSVQLRRTTNIKMHATKTFSAPPNRSVSMTNVSEAFCVQKTDLIAELKKTKDIPGIKKLKVQRAQVEKSQEQTLISEINKAFSIANFVDQIPEKDSSGNVIPIWKRQMLARKAAERAKKELEEQIARENEMKRIQAIPPWKRQLLAKKDSDCKPVAISLQTCLATASAVTPKVEVPIKKESEIPTPPTPMVNIPPAPPKIDEPTPPPPPPAPPANVNHEEKRNDSIDDPDSVHIIPWRAQLRKTNSKLNILD